MMEIQQIVMDRAAKDDAAIVAEFAKYHQSKIFTM